MTDVVVWWTNASWDSTAELLETLLTTGDWMKWRNGRDQPFP
ncbi:hypothetical protein [Methylocaldum sp.]|nr:hypothetical protein [Methylocaldum sp.]HYE37037.1 hypothetical protein [Methylocaldum sp.]